MAHDNDTAVKEMVVRFERGDLPLAEFSHAAHLTVGMFYLDASPSFDAAMKRMRTGVHGLLARHGKGGYHETITCFWMVMLAEVREKHAGAGLPELCQIAAGELGDKDLIYRYYDRELLMSDQARAVWVAPPGRGWEGVSRLPNLVHSGGAKR